MDIKAIQNYVNGFGKRFLKSDLLDVFPETRILPRYIQQHFASARYVLDLGFGTGLWFWASFLPSLKRIDGIDLYQAFLDESNRILHLDEVPDGYKLAHAYLGKTFTISDLEILKTTAGNLIIGDFTKEWPQSLGGPYDLVTEYGSIGEVKTNADFVEVVKKSSARLKPGGAMFFVNFLENEVDEHARKLERFTPDTLQLNIGLYEQAAKEARMRIDDFHVIDNPEGMPPIKTFFYGYAVK